MQFRVLTGKPFIKFLAGKYIFGFRQENTFFGFWRKKKHFHFSAGKHVSGFWLENCFMVFGGKTRFWGLAKNVFSRFRWKNTFVGFRPESVFLAGKHRVLAENTFSWVLEGKRVYRVFTRKHVFLVSMRKRIFRVLASRCCIQMLLQ